MAIMVPRLNFLIHVEQSMTKLCVNFYIIPSSVGFVDNVNY